MQSLLAQVSRLNVLMLSIPGLKEIPSPLYQVLMCKTAILPQLRQFWDAIWSILANWGPYIASIRGMRMKLPELQDDNKEAKKLMSKELLEGWKDIKELFHYQNLLYVLKIICSELISRHHNNLFASPFGIERTRELIAKKYHQPTV